jgi:hypothetical protein
MGKCRNYSLNSESAQLDTELATLSIYHLPPGRIGIVLVVGGFVAEFFKLLGCSE